MKEKDELGLIENADMRIRGTPLTSVVYEDRVYGRGRDKEAIVELLLSETYNNDGEI